MIDDKLITLVRAEAEALRINATRGERMKLDIKGLQPEVSTGCIYGQMTVGGCYSPRAIELLKLCGIPYSSFISYFLPTEKTFDRDHGVLRAFSAIEFYINQVGAKSKELIKYLREESKTLDI